MSPMSLSMRPLLSRALNTIDDNQALTKFNGSHNFRPNQNGDHPIFGTYIVEKHLYIDIDVSLIIHNLIIQYIC